MDKNIEVSPGPKPSCVLDFIRESVIVIGLDRRIVDWNRASESIYGLSRDQVVGRSFEVVLGVRHWPDAEPMVGLANAEPETVELRRVNASQEEVIVATRLVLRRDQAGVPLGWIEFGADVTAQRRAEWAEEASQLHYQNVFEAIPAAVCAVDFSAARKMALEWLKDVDVEPRQWFTEHPDEVRKLMRATLCLDVNDFTVELFRPPDRSGMLGSIDRFWPESTLPDYIDWIVNALSGQNTWQREIRQRTYDGVEFDSWFTSRFAPGTIDEGYFIVTVIDYTEVKRSQAAIRQSEAFYKDMFHGSAFSAWRLEASGAREIYAELREQGVTDFRAEVARNPSLLTRIMGAIKVVDVNESSVQLFEARDRSEMIGGPITAYWIPGNLEPLLGSLEASFNNIETFRSLGRMRTLRGREIDVLYTRSSSGALRAAGELLLAIVDITDKVQAQNALADMQTTLAHAARISSLGELTASIAHEVNQPLAAITVYGETSLRLLDRPEHNAPEIMDLTRRMIADARRASDIVSRIRAMAAPQVTPHHRMAINTLVADTLTFVRPELRKLGVAVQLELGTCVPEICGDNIQLQQVLVNFTVNALQAMEGMNDPQILIATSYSGDTVQIDFADNGPGIPSEDSGKLFSSFFTTKKNGIGIGLGICKSIVEAHKGTISVVRSGIGPQSRGARFVVRLPRVAD
ncbi:PAS domain-containing sensor histidine kinase [Roseateles noduli]|uniref:PAS domain-containing sensor histidine kinase n=1 Tax=Roseateles noduli TaxID=2052484 RepID=UPI003D653401